MNKSRWEEFDPSWHNSVKPSPGCYVLSVCGEVIYIGQSFNVRKRMARHGFAERTSPTGERYVATPWGNLRGSLDGKVRYSRRFGDHLMIEARLIERLQPRLNRKGVRHGR